VLNYQNIVSVCVTGGALLKKKPAKSSSSLYLFRFVSYQYRFFFFINLLLNLKIKNVRLKNRLNNAMSTP